MKSNYFSPFRLKAKLEIAAMAALICFGISMAVFADSGDKRDKERERRIGIEDVEVKNFGKVNDHIFRGGQPEEDEYEQLAAIGIKTVIDLRDDSKSKARSYAQRAGLNYINIPLDDKVPPTMLESSKFLSLVNDQENWPVYVHCAGGRHRTGVLVAVYRMEIEGWNAKQAYSEMKDFDFYSKWGHGDMKDYVFDYYRRMAAKRGQTASTRVRRVSASSTK